MVKAKTEKRQKRALDNLHLLWYYTGAVARQQKIMREAAESADSLDSGSSVHSGRAGSSPASRTNSSDSSEFEEFFFFYATETLKRTT